MKKLFLSLALICTALTSQACWVSAFDGVSRFCFPYISHVNGQQVCNMSVSIKNVQLYQSSWISWDVIPTRSNVSTNMPLTVRVAKVDSGAGTPPTPINIGCFSLWSKSNANSQVTLKLYYSTNSDGPWTLLATRKFSNVANNVLNGNIFGQDILPQSFADGTQLYLKLSTYAAGCDSVTFNMSLKYYDNYNDNWHVNGVTNGVVYDGNHNVIGYVGGTTIEASDTGFEFVCKITISGNRRGGSQNGN